jgi:hypothetical protein
MLRRRLAALSLAAGLSLAGGCSTFCNHPLFGHCGPSCAPVCDEGAVGFPVEEGPLLNGYIPPGTTAPVPVVPAPGTPQPLTQPPDRLVPAPAQPEPYAPSGGRRRSAWEP